MKAIILTAGIGSRIRPLTDNKPKSLLEIGGLPILGNMLSNIQSVGISEVIVITGYLEEMIKDYINSNFSSLSVTYIYNKKYLDTNTGYSLLLAKNAVGDAPFIKFDADVIFEMKVLESLVNDQHETALCIDRNINLEAEEVKVVATPNGKVIKVGKKLNPKQSSGESIGIEKIGKNASKILFKELATLMEDTANYNEYYDDSYTTLVEKGVPFYAVDITGLRWVEVDTHEDFQKAKSMFGDN